jgi:hypothetical protein
MLATSSGSLGSWNDTPGAIDKHDAGDETDVRALLAGVVGAFAGLDVEEYGRHAAAFVRDGHHPTLGRPFQAVGYEPMIEFLRYLEANGFTTMIASGDVRGAASMRPPPA